jgi:hypothetical protein
MRNVDLESKEAYLAWVAEWKVEWKQIVADIRKAKEARRFHRDEARRGAHRDGDVSHRDAMWAAHSLRMRLRWQAHALHMQRLEGKRLSWAKRNELKAKEEAEKKVA